MRTIALLIATLLLATISAFAQTWTRIDNLPVADFSALEIADGTIYAGSGQKMYYSTDTGDSWQQATLTDSAIEIRCFRKFGSRLYAGTSAGIYSAPLNNLSNWTHHLNSGWVSSFAETDGSLFASTIGGGVYMRKTDGSWINFSNGLPSYSLSVQKILVTPSGGLIAVAGANGTLYRFISEANNWTEDYYNGEGYDPGLDFDDAQLVGNTMYVSRYNKVLRSDNFGYTWIPDQVGLVNGHYRTIAVGTDEIYMLTTAFTGDSNITLLRKRNKNAPAQTDWSTDAELLDFYSYALAQLGDKIFIASNQGVYVKDGSLGTELPLQPEDEAVIYPNPSQDGRFVLKSPEAIDELTVYDLTGKCILTRQNLPAFYEFTIPGKGLYFVRTLRGENTKVFKVIARCQP